MADENAENPRKKSVMKAALPAASCAVAAAALAVLYFFDPSEGGLLFPPCPTEHLFGVYCPGCGSLRAVHALLHLDFIEAFSQNCLLFIMAPLVALMLIFPQKFSGPRLSASIAAIFILYMVLRNIPAHPFALLAPH